MIKSAAYCWRGICSNGTNSGRLKQLVIGETQSDIVEVAKDSLIAKFRSRVSFHQEVYRENNDNSDDI